MSLQPLPRIEEALYHYKPLQVETYGPSVPELEQLGRFGYTVIFSVFISLQLFSHIVLNVLLKVAFTEVLIFSEVLNCFLFIRSKLIFYCCHGRFSTLSMH